MTNTLVQFRVDESLKSDEISLLFHLEENTFARKVRKYNLILAGVASSALLAKKRSCHFMKSIQNSLRRFW